MGDQNTVVMGDGPPVVLIHGLLLGSLAQWYFTVAPALAVRHRVLLYDLRGHGLSAAEPSGYDLATLVGDLERVLADNDVSGPVDLVGHSYGGLIALTFALGHPARVRRLVVIDVPLPPGSSGLIDDAASATPASLLALVPDAVRDAILGGGRRARRLLERLQFLAQQSTLLADVAREPDLDDAALATLACPVSCVVGATSACRGAADRLVRTLPDARLVVVPGGHFVPIEAPTEMTAAIAGFLDG